MDAEFLVLRSGLNFPAISDVASLSVINYLKKAHGIMRPHEQEQLHVKKEFTKMRTHLDVGINVISSRI